MAKTHLETCPICKGTGKIEIPARLPVDGYEIKKRIARELHEKGYSVRQIMRALGYKSPRSIQLMLKEE